MLAGGHVLAQFPTYGFLINVLWSPNGKYVAVNNRRANSGDYLWVISLQAGAALRKPDHVPCDAALDRVLKAFPQYASFKNDRVFTFATGWTSSSELTARTRVLLTGDFKGKDAVEILVNDTYKIQGKKLAQRSEKIEMPEKQNLGYWPKIR